MDLCLLVAPSRERELKPTVKITQAAWAAVAPSRERELKRIKLSQRRKSDKVAPSRERELKLNLLALPLAVSMSLPHGSVN